jgi:hypothetical protein
MTEVKLCGFPVCDKPATNGGYCSAHFKRTRIGKSGTCRVRPIHGEVARYLDEIAMNYEGDGCLTWPFSRTLAGYPIIRINGMTNIASRVICRRTHGEPPSVKYHAAHSCGNGDKGCVNKRHIFWKTPKDNNGDKLAHGTDNRGQKHGNAKLSADDVLQMRALRGILTNSEIARKFNISPSHVTIIFKGEQWGWLRQQS